MGRTKEQDKIQKLIRLPPDLWMESIMLNPILQDETGYMRYGGISQYFIKLMREDNERIKDRLRKERQANGTPYTSI